MHQPWRAIPILTLLSLSSFVRPTPTPYGNALAIRGDDDLPRELQPVLQDDGLPDGDPDDALQDYDYTVDEGELESCPDFDPNQGTKGGDDTASKHKRGFRMGRTKILRSISVNGKLARAGFLASADKKSVAIKAKGNRAKNTPVITFETPRILPKIPNKEVWEQWQADHVCDLGIYTDIARGDTPKGIKEAAWTTVQDAILGEEQQNGDLTANGNTKVLGRILNTPQNIRGISKEMNTIKNYLMKWAYTTETARPDFYGDFRRSNVWGLYRQLVRTKKQFDDASSKTAKAFRGFIKDDDDSAKAVEKYFNDQSQQRLKKATDQLADVLKDPPSDDPKKKIFGIEDCSNTAADPDDPTAKDPAPQAATSQDSCDVSYNFLYDSFEIRGKNFDKTKFGNNGEGLKKQLDGCASITHYKFQWTPNDPKYQWYVTGHALVGEKDCIGHAVETAGGTTAGNCHGAG